MVLSEAYVTMETLAVMYLLTGTFFTFAGLRWRKATFCIFGFIAMSFLAELWISSIHSDFPFLRLTEPAIFWTLLILIGYAGGVFVYFSEPMAKFCTCCIPTYFVLSLLWQVLDISHWRLVPRDPFLKSLHCFTTSSFLATLMLTHVSPSYYETFLLFASSFFGAYLMIAGGSLVHRVISGRIVVRITPADLMSYRKDYYPEDRPGVAILWMIPILLLALALCGVWSQHLQLPSQNGTALARRGRSKQQKARRGGGGTTATGRLRKRIRRELLGKSSRSSKRKRESRRRRSRSTSTKSSAKSRRSMRSKSSAGSSVEEQPSVSKEQGRVWLDGTINRRREGEGWRKAGYEKKISRSPHKKGGEKCPDGTISFTVDL
eukprot:GEMP01044519.1.p1 GENE.GEMP01044519.1~~GEMP01044519.1.p1  ORF type:complete len:376 (+),score=42.08 GEMP01044519.1:165-1292(+)